MTPFFGNGIKVKIPSEIKLPLIGGGGGGGFLIGGGCKTESFKLESRNPCIKVRILLTIKGHLGEVSNWTKKSIEK